MTFDRIADKSKKVDPILVMAIQMLFGMLISGAIVLAQGQGGLSQIDWKETYGSALFFVSASLSNYSLAFVDFPFMALAKSAKIIPVALIGTLLGVYKLQFF